MLSGSLPPNLRARGVTAVLGPTNTGKTHLAIERMLGHSSGLIGLPLRLLAREVYNRVVERVGKDRVALVTGEEKIKPRFARYWISTVEAMPRDLDVAFLAVDEIQLAADADRGHVFTNAMLNMRGREETLIIGSATMKPLVERLLPGANIIARPRLSKLTFAGERKITRLPPRSAIVAFSAEEVYAIAELIRRQRGGAAVVMGALSPRTRNAQVELFQNGDVDHIVATDAIGMGLNLEIDHVAFAADRKFDGQQHRRLIPAEMAQIAGRAGRHLKDGTFGTSARCAAFDQDLVEQLESHDFDAVRTVNWRNPDLSFASLDLLKASLAVLPQEMGVVRCPTAADEHTLEIAAAKPEIRDLASTPAAVRRLWEVCALPDYRKVAHHHHAELVITIYEFLMRREFIPVDWFGEQVALCNRTEGEIDTLSARLAQIRTWTFCANRLDWLRDPEHWQRVTRKVEDGLSDALHEKLAARFVDRRTSVLMRRLRENSMLEADVSANGDVTVEGQHVGKLSGFRFTADTQGIGVDTPEAKALRAAAAKSLASEIEARAARLGAADDASFALGLDGAVRWQGEVVAKLKLGDKALEPQLVILADEHLAGPPRDQVEARLALWLKAHVARYLSPLLALEAGDALSGIGRGLAYQLAENLGVLERTTVAGDVKSLDQPGRAELRKLGIRFGSHHIYMPQLMKPAPRALAAQLWMLKHGGAEPKGLDDIVHLASSGRTSFPADESLPKGLYRAAGFRVAGPRAVRIDILERLADIIRPAISFRPGVTPGVPPQGAAEGDGFVVSVGMTSLVGCSGEDFAAILKSLGYRSEMKPKPEAKPVIPLPGAAASIETVETAEVSQFAAAEGEVPEASDLPSLDTAPADAGASQPDVPTEATPDRLAQEPPQAAGEASVEASGDATIEAVGEAMVEVPAELVSEGDVSEPAAIHPVTRGDESDSTAATVAEEASPVSAADPEPDGVVEPAPPQMIEVWRPGRSDRGEGNRPERRRKPASSPKAGRQLWVRGPEKPQAPAAPAEPRTLWTRDQSAPAPRRAEDGDRAEGGNRGRGERKGGERVDAPTGHAGDARGKRGGGRPDRQGEGRSGGFQRGGGKPHGSGHAGSFAAPPPRAERQADPDSPFAKLAALKAQLEGKI